MSHNKVYELALNFTLKWEGLPSKYAQKRGRATKYGIDQETYDECYTLGLVPKKDIAHITHEEAERVYFYKYWRHMGRFTSMTWYEFQVTLFDTFVQFDVPGGIAIWQRALGVREDGIWGPATERATWAYIEKRGSLGGALKLIAERMRHRPQQAKEDGSQGLSLRGLIKRDIELIEYVFEIHELAQAFELPS
jgi:lysozyme family protein